MIIQLTGLSGAGKTSIAAQTELLLQQEQITVAVVDGDVYRKTLCKDLGFSEADRKENIRRLGKAAHELEKEYQVVLIAAISPFESVRHELEMYYSAITVWVNCPLEELIRRDTKQLYQRALLPDNHPDKIYNLTGVNDVYETPAVPALILYTNKETPAQSAQRLYQLIVSNPA